MQQPRVILLCALIIIVNYHLCSHQPIEQRPRQDESGQSPGEPTRPQLQRSTEVPARVEDGLSRGDGGRGDADGVEEQGRQEGEGDVEEEAVVGLEAEDACCDAKEGGGQGLQVGEGLEGERCLFSS